VAAVLEQLYDKTLMNIIQILMKHEHFGALCMRLDDVDKYKNYYICDDELV
jgi:hypothetical protein